MTTPLRLFVNIDHVATLRQARRGDEPDPIAAAHQCMLAGADGITAHLREDRRHIQDADLRALAALPHPLNFECAATDEMIGLAETLLPREVTLVPERREEVTTEGGLDVARQFGVLRHAAERLQRLGITCSLFIDAHPDSIRRAVDTGARAVELHTGPYAHAVAAAHAVDGALTLLRDGATLAASLGLHVHAGHGLTARNVGAVAGIPEMEELNIGHSIVSNAVFVGLDASVRAVHHAMRTARASMVHTPASPSSTVGPA